LALLARVINLSNVHPDIVERILQEAAEVKNRRCKWLLPIEGIYFNEEEKRITFYMPQKLSLFDLLHESDRPISSEEKKTIATSIAKAMKKLHKFNAATAHTHLTSKNVLLDPNNF
jgi:serine/threonine protein kinase